LDSRLVGPGAASPARAKMNDAVDELSQRRKIWSPPSSRPIEQRSSSPRASRRSSPSWSDHRLPGSSRRWLTTL